MRRLLPWFLPLTLLLLWQLASTRGWMSAQILPTPAAVGEVGRQFLLDGELARHAGVSLLRVLQGYAAGVVAGLLLGLAMGLSPRAEDYLYPSFNAIAQVPTLGWIPLFMLLFGIDETLKIVVILKAAIVPVTLNTLAGVRGVDPRLLELARVLRFGPLRTVRRVVLPAAFPAIFSGLRIGLAQAWIALVAVELIASSEGLGFLIVDGRQLFHLDVVIVGILAIGLVGLVMNRSLAALEGRLLRWRPARG